jgi:phosphoesterase RecJ-like protein
MNNISNFFQLKSIFMSQQSYKIIVTTHKNPDGDALGSSIAISRFLRKLGHKVSIVNFFKKNSPILFFYIIKY